MQNEINNSKTPNNVSEFEYIGTVDIKLNIKGKTYEINGNNAGSVYLKYILAKALAGEFDNNTFAPGYISIWRQENDESEILEYTVRKIQLSAPQLVDQVNGFPTAITFTANIGYDDLQDVVQATDSAKYWFYLFPRFGNYYLASIAVTPVSLSYISPGTTATVTWTLRIVNHSEY